LIVRKGVASAMIAVTASARGTVVICRSHSARTTSVSVATRAATMANRSQRAHTLAGGRPRQGAKNGANVSDEATGSML
jgi:hypothetical protein